MSLTTSNERIIEFYKKYEYLNFDQVNLFLIDMLEKTLQKDIPHSIVADMNNTMVQLQKQMVEMNGQISHMHLDTQSTINMKLLEMKDQYIEQVKMILSTNISDKIVPILKENTSIFIDKTQIYFNDVLPRNNDSIKQDFKILMTDLEKSIMNDTKSYDPTAMLSFIQTIDSKVGAVISKQDTGFSEIRDITSNNQQQVSSLLNKMENSSSKGKISENMLDSLLHTIYPSATIDSVGTQKETGDVMLLRTNKPTILIENKNWERNVLQTEVQKFIRDCETQKCSGLFLSQNFGICNKENFEINIHDGNVLLYIHAVNYDPNVIKAGIDIIDHLKTILESINSEVNVNTIEKEVLDHIHQEYNAHKLQKDAMQKMIKDSQSRLLKQLDEFQMPNLEKYLSIHYASAMNIKTCDFCGYVAKSNSALSAHHRGCKIKKSNFESSKQDLLKPDE
jgi:hypothetical protein